MASAFNQMGSGAIQQLMTPETMASLQQFATNTVAAFQNPSSQPCSRLPTFHRQDVMPLAGSVNDLPATLVQPLVRCWAKYRRWYG
jgi:hypothetical protein